MNWGNLHILHLLWFLPVLAWLLHVLFNRRLKLMSRFIDLRLLPSAAREGYRGRWRIKAVLLLVCAGLLIVALARPQWGYQWQQARMQGIDILLAVDVSKSMLTQDVKPNRLDRTKLAIEDLIKKLRGDRIGLIAFAGDAFLICPLTNDYSGFLLSLNDLNVGTVPRGGTNLGRAIREAIKDYGNKAGHKNLVLVTDGEEEEGDAVKAAHEAKEKGVVIYTVGVGTKEGDLIQVPNDQGQLEFLKDSQGDYVKSHLNENLLQQIAYITGGAYVRSSGAEFGLDFLYDHQLSKIEKRNIKGKMEKKYDDHFQLFLGLALVLLLAETFLNAWRPND